jgi:hypothetical protein
MKKNIVRITETDLVKLIKKMISEQQNGINQRFDDDIKKKHHLHTNELRHSEPDEFTLVGRLQMTKNPPAKTPNFVLRTRNKTEDGTRILAGIELIGYEDKIVKLTGKTKDGSPPSFKNPLKLTKRPQILSK